MNYGRETLRKAGQAFLDADRAYAEALVPRAKSQEQPIATMTRGIPLEDIINMVRRHNISWQGVNRPY